MPIGAGLITQDTSFSKCQIRWDSLNPAWLKHGQGVGLSLRAVDQGISVLHWIVSLFRRFLDSQFKDSQTIRNTKTQKTQKRFTVLKQQKNGRARL
tara:strand:- start:23 stop:310 length:288 start_codon:yes stop_codon:yes gene_type:complete